MTDKERILPPGRELDVQVALAMGWTKHPATARLVKGGNDPDYDWLWVPPQFNGDTAYWRPLPHLSTDPTAMMDSWKWLNEQGFLVRVQTHPDGEPFLMNANDEPEMPVHAKAACILDYLRGMRSQNHAEHRWWFLNHILVMGDTPAHVLALAVVEVSRRRKEAQKP